MAVNTNHFIVDASYLLSTLLPDEKIKSDGSSRVRLISDPSIVLFAPSLLAYEVCNSLKSAVLQNRLLPKRASFILKNFSQLPIRFIEIDLKFTLDLAIKHRLSFYDASYLYLSLSKKCPILSLDTHLTRLSQNS